MALHCIAEEGHLIRSSDGKSTTGLEYSCKQLRAIEGAIYVKIPAPMYLVCVVSVGLGSKGATGLISVRTC